MFTQGTYYKFGMKVFHFSLIRSAIIFVVCMIVVLIAFGVVGFSSKIGLNIFLIGTILLLVYAIGAILMARYNYACHQFMLDEYAIHIRTGIVNRSEMSIPYRQIQDVNVEDSYIQRAFGVAELSVLTAGHEDAKYAKSGEAGVPAEESSALFPLVDRSYADELQKELMRRSSVQEVVSVSRATSV